MKELFFEYWNSCFLATCELYPQSIFHIYDKNVLRERKLCRVLNIEESKTIFEFKDIENAVMFEEDYKNNYLWINYWKIWNRFSLTNNEIRNIISSWFKDGDLVILKPFVLKPDFVFSKPRKCQNDTKFESIKVDKKENDGLYPTFNVTRLCQVGKKYPLENTKFITI